MRADKRRHIFALVTEIGLSEEERRTIQHAATGKESLRDMSNEEADALIKTLIRERNKKLYMTPQESIAKGRVHNTLPKGGNLFVFPTEQQIAKIKALSIHITGSADPQALDRFAMRQYRKPFKQLSAQQAARMIETQKQILKRKIATGGKR